jgi:branched-chain amino acid transport system substrate-binding protein
MLKQRGILTITAAAVGLMLAGCSSSSSSPSAGSGSSSASGGSTSPSVAASSAAATSTPIPIGVVGSYSGSLASSISAGKGSIQAWADSVNAAGGIGGHPVKLYVKDDGGNPATSLTAVKALVTQDHIVALVGEAAQSSASWASYITAQGVPVVGGNTVDATALSSPDFFGVGGNILSNFFGVAAVAKSDGPKLGNLYCAELAACASTTTLLQAFGSSLGLTVPYASKVAATAPDFTAVCQGLKNAGVGSYTLGLAAATLKRVAAACVQQGLKAKLVLSNVSDSTYPSNAAFNGMQIVDTVFPYFQDSTPATKAFHAALAKYEPTLGTASNPLNSEAAMAWASGKLFEAAVNAVGTGAITPASIKTALYTLKNETLGGLTVPLSFTPGKTPTLHNCYFAYAIDGSKFVTTDNYKPACAPDKVIDAVAAKL